MLKTDLITLLNNSNLNDAQNIRTTNDVYSSSDVAYAFIITTLRAMYPNISDSLLKNSITDGDNDGSLDVIYENRKNKTIDIYDVKKGKKFNYKEIKAFKSDLKEYLFNNRKKIDALSDLVRPKLLKARALLKKYKVNLYIVRGGNLEPEAPVIKLLEDFKAEFHKIDEVVFLNSNRLIDKIINFHNYKSYTWNINIAGKEKILDPENILMKKYGAISSMYGLISLNKIAQLYKDYELKGLDLFNKNIREFQNNKAMSTKIKKTIEKYPNKFYIYHNGLTLSCKKIMFNSRYEFTIEDPQVINGCQTVNTIYEYSENGEKKQHLNKSLILCKFY